MDATLISIALAFLGTMSFFLALESLHWLLRPRHLHILTPASALRDWFVETGHPRYNVNFIEKGLFLFVMWTLLAFIFWIPAQWVLLASIWWTWRRGVFR